MITLDALIVSMFRNRQTNTTDFKCLVNLYGRDKIAQAWESSFLPKSKIHSKAPNLTAVTPVVKYVGRGSIYTSNGIYAHLKASA